MSVVYDRRPKIGIYTPKNSIEVYKYSSEWELEYMEYLDSCQEIKEWIYEPFSLRYLDKDGYPRFYVPDFKITYTDGTVEVHEIKPRYLINNPIIAKKLEVAEEHCKINGWTFKVITESDIQRLRDWKRAGLY